MALDAEQLRKAARRIAAWRADPRAPVACPVCGKPGLAIIDRSARPHAEWYVLTCSSCGLSETLNVPLGPAVPSLD
jgi:transcription elongation factor Elf1